MSSSVRAGRRDPGAQPERTRLSWRRTTLTFALVVVLAARKLVLADGSTGAAAAAVAAAALLWTGFLLLAHRRMRVLGGRSPRAVRGATMLGAAGTVVLAAVLGAALLTMPPR